MVAGKLIKVKENIPIEYYYPKTTKLLNFVEDFYYWFKSYFFNTRMFY